MKYRVYGVKDGANGIGFATTRLISECGGIVCIGGVDSEALQQAEYRLATKVVPFLVTHLDVLDKSQVESWVASIMSMWMVR